jgi:hypothetical protein
MTRRRRASLEERMAWDQYVAAWSVALGYTHASRNDGEDDPITAAEYADDVLRERRKRFGRARRSKSRLH